MQSKPMSEHRVGDLIYDWAYKDFGIITKIWTIEELKKAGKRPPYYTIEVKFPNNRVMPVDRYTPETIEKFKSEMRERYYAAQSR